MLIQPRNQIFSLTGLRFMTAAIVASVGVRHQCVYLSIPSSVTARTAP
jgi:hypothetical protein